MISLSFETVMVAFLMILLIYIFINFLNFPDLNK
jgi:hypothetical protein